MLHAQIFRRLVVDNKIILINAHSAPSRTALHFISLMCNAFEELRKIPVCGAPFRHMTNAAAWVPILNVTPQCRFGTQVGGRAKPVIPQCSAQQLYAFLAAFSDCDWGGLMNVQRIG